ncbi:hypothetical protein Ancab_003044 [Ancistrocladus abbreviatus]
MMGNNLAGRFGGPIFLGKLFRSCLEPKLGVASSRQNCLAFSSASTTTTSNHEDFNNNHSASHGTPGADQDMKITPTANVFTNSSVRELKVNKPPRPKVDPGRGSQHNSENLTSVD